uniref:YfbR-like 5'-deoxynucleotidase n=1 Tax=uncultured Neisseria sp. TaxID=237778 RepID=UPI002612FA93
MKPRFYWAACAVLLAACSPEPAAEKTVSAASQATSATTLTVPTARGDAVVPKNPERIAVMAMYHDTSEIFTGDLPTPIKYFNPEITHVYKQI